MLSDNLPRAGCKHAGYESSAQFAKNCDADTGARDGLIQDTHLLVRVWVTPSEPKKEEPGTLGLSVDSKIIHAPESAEVCSVHWMAREFGDKWSLPILCRLSAGPLRFLQLKRALGPVSQRMLTRTLKKLEQLGIVLRTPHLGPALQVTYELTQSGQTLYNAVRLLDAWLAKHELAPQGNVICESAIDSR